MATLTATDVWNNHPYPDSPCDTNLFRNQCAIRMGVALAACGVNLRSFQGAKCWVNHSPRHILRAQELANWMLTQRTTFGTVKKHRRGVTFADFAGKRGIVFIQNGWGPTDHIDIWDGSRMKGGDPSYFAS
jgi:hypothetical protein